MTVTPQDATVLETPAADFNCVFVDGEFVDAVDARLSVKANAVSYGTGVFDGMRASWNADEQELYLLEPHAHYERLSRSANALGLELRYSPDELVELTIELLRHNRARQDSYVRPLLLLTGDLLTVRLHEIDCSLIVYCCAFPAEYVAQTGVRARVSSWRRISDDAIPLRAKVIGSYVNNALAKTEAVSAGADETIMLNAAGNVCEASTSNIFLRRDGCWLTPSVNEDILEGITRRQLLQLIAQVLEEPVTERAVDRSELYACDEALICGTAVQVAPLLEVDGRPIGNRLVGERTRKLMHALLAISRREYNGYEDWTTPVWHAA
jgi:branched-chain amino acid aminotransferase